MSEPTGIKKLKEHFPNSFLTGLETLPGYIRIPKITSCTYQWKCQRVQRERRVVRIIANEPAERRREAGEAAAL